MHRPSPLVSVIVPAYNAERYIAEAIQSVIDQTYENWELLVIDDGSTDATAEIVSTFDDERICLIQQLNKGVSAARNTGLEKATGTYITFLDADDTLPIRSLQARVEYLENHPDIHVVDGVIMVKDENFQKTLRSYQPYFQGRLLPRLIALDSRVFFNVCYMFRHCILREIRFNECMTHAEDLLFYIELSNAYPLLYGYVLDEVYWYRSGHTSAMTNLDGLEKGYKQLIGTVGRMKNVTFSQKARLRLRIVRIMFLSWLKHKKFYRAFFSVSIILN